MIIFIFLNYDFFQYNFFVFNFILKEKVFKCMWERGENNGKEGGVLSI
jgi:hypothetical protein